jgi:hypothetical protein
VLLSRKRLTIGGRDCYRRIRATLLSPDARLDLYELESAFHSIADALATAVEPQQLFDTQIGACMGQ